MAGRVRAHDWAATPLGPIETWPASLKAVVDMLLASGFPIVALWGPELVQIYNDGYRALMGDKHPAGLGQATRLCWPEVWHINEPIYELVRAGETLSFEDRLYPIMRHSSLEDAWFTLSYSPLRNEDGKVAGVLVAVFETTARHVAEAHRDHVAAVLRESEARFRALVTASSYAVYRMSPDWSEMRQLDGRGFIADTPGPSRTWLEAYIHSDDQPAVIEAIQEAIRAKRMFELEHRVRRLDGSLGWTLSRAVPLLGEDGEVTEWFGAASDVTDRKQAEAALRESEERFREFAENSADVLWIVNAETMRFEYLSPAFEAVWGESRERLMADLRHWSDLVHPDDRALAAQVMPPDLAGEARTQEYRIVRPSDGAVRWICDTGFPIPDAKGCLRRIGGIAQDITEHRRAEAAMRESEALLRALVEGLPQLVWRATGNGEWAWASRQWCAYTGLSQGSSRGLGWLDALHPDDRSAAIGAWRAAETLGDMQTEFRVFNAGEGIYRWFQGRGTPLRDGQGSVAEWLGTATDIDDQVRAREVLARSRDDLEAMVEARTGELMAAEAALRQSQKMEAVGQLTGGIAHDFNNMLQGIAGSLELLGRRVEQGRATEAMHYVASSRMAVQRAAALTHRLLAFARQVPLAPMPVNLTGLAANMAELIRRTVGPQIQVELRPTNDTWLVLCDENQMENALLNLCVNARDAMPNGGWLTIATEDLQLSQTDLPGEEGLAPGPYVAIAVTDTGVGMDPEVVARAFEPFFTTKPAGQGTGLGLSQIYGFLHQSGGFVRIESVPGEGTTVRLLLPRHEPVSAESTQGSTDTAGVVLLVEDEELLRQAAAEWLRDTGCRVLEAADGAAALRMLHGAGRVDALVTDVGLPGGINGRQLAESASERRPGLPVLLMTGYAGTKLPSGMDVIRKPFALDELSRRVWGMLEMRSDRDAAASGGS